MVNEEKTPEKIPPQFTYKRWHSSLYEIKRKYGFSETRARRRDKENKNGLEENGGKKERPNETKIEIK